MLTQLKKKERFWIARSIPYDYHFHKFHLIIANEIGESVNEENNALNLHLLLSGQWIVNLFLTNSSDIYQEKESNERRTAFCVNEWPNAKVKRFIECVKSNFEHRFVFFLLSHTPAYQIHFEKQFHFLMSISHTIRRPYWILRLLLRALFSFLFFSLCSFTLLLKWFTSVTVICIQQRRIDRSRS